MIAAAEPAEVRQLLISWPISRRMCYFGSITADDRQQRVSSRPFADGGEHRFLRERCADTAMNQIYSIELKQKRKRMRSGDRPGLQNRRAAGLPVAGGFDPHSLPPNAFSGLGQ